MLGTFVNCRQWPWCNSVNKATSSFSNCQRQNKDHCALANCGRVEFLKLR